ISFAQSAGQQVAMDVTRGLLQGTSGYLAKKFRTVKVKLKAGYKVMLYAKQQ
ncbi:conjugative transposon protein TraM, partial [Parabacteroides merdae]